MLDTGAVIARLDGRRWLVNTTVDRYRASLEYVGRMREHPAGGDAELVTRLSAIDPLAFDHPDSYWAAIAEQYGDELF